MKAARWRKIAHGDSSTGKPKKGEPFFWNFDVPSVGLYLAVTQRQKDVWGAKIVTEQGDAIWVSDDNFLTPEGAKTWVMIELKRLLNEALAVIR